MQEKWDHIHNTFGSGFLLTRFISATVSPVCFCSLAILKHLHAVAYYCRQLFSKAVSVAFFLVMKSQEWEANLWVTTPLHIVFDLLPQSFFSSHPMRRQKKLKSSLLAVPSRTLQGRWSRASRGFTLMQTGFRAFKRKRISPRQWQS